MSVISFLVAILPIILIGMYIYRKDKIKESSNLLFKLFVGGILSCFPSAMLGLIFGSFFPVMEDMNFIQLFLYVFVTIAFVEELCKWVILYKMSYNNTEFDSFYDMIVYASFIALGFACFENILYVSDAGIKIGLLRAITAVPGHVCDGILMGSYLSVAKINQIKGNYELSKKYKILSLVIPVITHGIYDFRLFCGTFIFVIIFILFVIFLFVICVKKVKDVARNNVMFNHRNNYCIGCSNLVNTNYCTRYYGLTAFL